MSQESSSNKWWQGLMHLFRWFLRSKGQESSSNKWWQGLTAYHWFVFAMASLAWLFDCLDQQIFILVRKDALKYLLPPGMDGSQIGVFSGYATSIFMVGWATGGLIFGSVGDWFGRAKTLTLTVFLYSVCTGLSAFSTGWFDFAVYRFITGMGVGGVFGLAVTLVADSLPSNRGRVLWERCRLFQPSATFHRG